LFGPFEDAMCRQSSTLFHTRLSSLLNIGRLLPRRLVLEAEQLAIDLPSKEGFIRQILGWREFVHHVHEATDGFRQDPLRPGMSWPSEGRPGSGGYEEWKNEPWPVQRADSVRGADEPDGGAAPTYLGPGRPMLPAYWGVESGLACLDRVVADVWREGYSHHITRLMVLANIASLLDLSPRAVTDWFWVAYTDAYDWVVEPNVLAMGMFAVGPVMTTKPYVAGSAYIHRMSDYCGECSFDPKKNCPLARLYWAYLNRHADALADNPRLSLPLASAARRPSNEQALDRLTFEIAHRILSAGGKLRPDDFVPVDTLQKHSPKR
jgi:deoxyribodipyrimidine photolyase-related protein